MKLAITLDMVGRLRDEQLYVLGTRSGYGLRRLLSGPVEDPSVARFRLGAVGQQRSLVVSGARVPVVLLHTGLHGDYHRPSDDVEKINREGMREVSRYLLAHVDQSRPMPTTAQVSPAVVSRKASESRQRAAERLLPKVSLRNWPANQPRPRLGISWREDEAEPGTVFLTRVVDGTPAACGRA